MTKALEIMKLVENGTSVKQAAVELGIARRTAYKLLDRAGLRPKRSAIHSRPNRLTEDTFAKIIEARRFGSTWGELHTMAKWGKSVASFRETIKYHVLKRGMAWPIEK